MPLTSTEKSGEFLSEKNLALEAEVESLLAIQVDAEEKLSALTTENLRLEAALKAALADVQTMKAALNRFQLGKDSLTAQARALLGTLALMPNITIVNANLDQK